MSGRSLPGDCPIFRGKNVAHLIRRSLVHADFDERADNISDHVMQIRIRANVYPHQRFFLLHMQAENRANRGFRAARRRLKRGEIMTAD